MQTQIATYLEANGFTLENLAERFGVNKTTVLRWKDGRIPAERVLDIERVTGISRHDLRPDLYPREAAQ